MRCSICLAALAAGFLIPSTSALPLSVAGQIPQQIRAVSSPGQPLELGFTSRRAQRQSRSSSGRIRSRALGLDPRQAADAEAQLWNLDDTRSVGKTDCQDCGRDSQGGELTGSIGNCRYIVDVTVAGQDLQVCLPSSGAMSFLFLLTELSPSLRYDLYRSTAAANRSYSIAEAQVGIAQASVASNIAKSFHRHLRLLCPAVESSLHRIRRISPDIPE